MSGDDISTAWLSSSKGIASIALAVGLALGGGAGTALSGAERGEERHLIRYQLSELAKKVDALGDDLKSATAARWTSADQREHERQVTVQIDALKTLLRAEHAETQRRVERLEASLERRQK